MAGPDYDALYHRFFSHPGVVAQLLRGFVDGPWLGDLDLDGMERLNTKFYAETGQRRVGDMIWRIPRRDGVDTYLVLLLEFQSTSEHFMALRMLAYAALLWQQLVTEQSLGPSGRLPPLLPVVLYNGDARWLVPASLRDLVGLPKDSPLWQWQPDLRYYPIDAGAFSQTDLQAREGLPALWFRLENAADSDQLLDAADAALAWFARHPGFAVAQAAFTELLSAIVASSGPGLSLPEDLLEVRNMLLNRVERWQQEWLQEGLQKGRQEGRQEGEAALLLRLLERRFGILPEWARDRVLAADSAVLEEWGLRLLDAGNLDDVIGGRPAE
jgi:hypothetical protein